MIDIVEDLIDVLGLFQAFDQENCAAFALIIEGN